MKEKILHHYKQQIYTPLMKLKNKDIFKYEKRKDYQQIMAMNDPHFKEINKCMSDIHKEDSEHHNLKIQMKIDLEKNKWLINMIE